jgi:LPPG:FO 2-phospho-L-lactate transferase
MARDLGVTARVLPMSDDPVRTKVRTDQGWLDFQDYFVRRGQADDVLELRFEGADRARTTPEVLETVAAAELIVVAPSNPFVSVAPILAVPGMLDALLRAGAWTLAVSPIVGGAAVRGPAAAMLRSLENREPTSAAIAAHYGERYPGLIDTLVIDTLDRAQAGHIAALGVSAVVGNTLIAREPDRQRLAERILTSARSSSSPDR